MGLECNTSPHKLIGPFRGKKIKIHGESYKLIVSTDGPLRDLVSSDIRRYLTDRYSLGKLGIICEALHKTGVWSSHPSSHCDSNDSYLSHLSCEGAKQWCQSWQEHRRSEDVQRCVLLSSDCNSPAVRLCCVGSLYDLLCLILPFWITTYFIPSKVCFQDEYLSLRGSLLQLTKCLQAARMNANFLLVHFEL